MTVYSSLLGFPQPVRPAIFISYHHHGDQAWYDHFSATFHDTYKVIRDTSLEREVDSDDAETVMRNIRENCITGSSCTIVLVGRDTWGRRYVDWEIAATLDKQHSLIAISLPAASAFPDRLWDNVLSGYALWKTWHQITADPDQLRQCIAEADLRRRIYPSNNNRPRRLKSATLYPAA